MKKFLVLFLLSITLSCSTEDNEQLVKSINPPSWLQGEWVYNESVFQPKYEFKQDDMIRKISIVSYVSIKERINEAVSQNLSVDIEEEITTNSYKLYINIAGEEDLFYFEKIDSTHFVISDWIYTKI